MLKNLIDRIRAATGLGHDHQAAWKLDFKEPLTSAESAAHMLRAPTALMELTDEQAHTVVKYMQPLGAAAHARGHEAVGRSLAPAHVLREMLHLMSELLGLNRGRIGAGDPARAGAQVAAAHRVHPACLRPDAGGVGARRYAWGEGITGKVLATGSRPSCRTSTPSRCSCSAP
jgi:hypothetical protein